MQPAAEWRQTAQYGWLVVKQATYTATIFSVSCCYSGRTNCLIIEKYKILLCTVRIIITYCVSFPAAKGTKNSFGIKASGCKATEWRCRYPSPDKLISSGLYSTWFSLVGSSRFYSLRPRFLGWTATTQVAASSTNNVTDWRNFRLMLYISVSV